MADITRFPGIRHYRGTPTVHVRHLQHGRLRHDGVGQAFWFRPLSAALSELPVDDRELPLLFHARTVDFQDVTVQATVTFRVSDPGLAAERIDFSLDPDTGHWRGTPLEQVAGLLTETAQQQALALLAQTPLAEALTGGVASVRARVAAGLADDPRLVATGIAVIGVRVLAIRPTPDVEAALQTPTREQIQQEADRATYQRRALAVERERAISANELQNKIELARREEDLVAQRGVNARRQAEEAAAAGRIESDAQADRERLLATARAAAARAMGEAQAAAEAAHVAAYRDVGDGLVIGLALKDLAANFPQIQSLVLTPDLLAPVLGRLATGAASGERTPEAEGTAP